MNSRSTRSQRTPSPSPSSPVLRASPRTARKSMGNRGRRSNANVVTSSANNQTSNTTSQSNRGRPSKRTRRSRITSTSSDSSLPNSQNSTAAISNASDSSDSEVAGPSNQRKPPKRKQAPVSDNEGSDLDYAPPANESARDRSLPSTSTGRSSVPDSTVYNVRNAVATMGLNTSRDLNSSVSSSSQGSFMKLVNKCVFYILVADQKKHAIKKTDILKYVFENQKSKEIYTSVFNKANEVLQKTFGLEILEINDKKNNYILINILDSDNIVRDLTEYSSEQLQKKGLIFLLLTIIFMSENTIAEEKLWKALEPLGLFPNSQIPHPVFGNVKKYITNDLVKEMYLDYICVNKDPVQYEFKWGERAVQEIKKEDLLEFACKMMDDNTKPEDWKVQYIDATKGRPSAMDA